MPVVGVASKLRQPSAVGTKPVHSALPIPSAVRAATSQGFMAQQRELRASAADPGLACQLSIKSDFQHERRPEGKSGARTEESRICKVSSAGVSSAVPSGVCQTRAVSHERYGGMMLRFAHRSEESR